MGLQNNTPDEINGVDNADSCYKEAVQYGASFVMSHHHCLPVFHEICGTATNFAFFLVRVGLTQVKIPNTSLDRSAALIFTRN